jgi:DNA repair protein RadA/Sms
VLAVLGRHGGVSLGSADVFVSVAGGVRVDEPGADLAIALALASAAKGIAPTADRPLAAFGELGLTGELRHVGHADRRIAEARKFGLERVVCPSQPVTTLRHALGVLTRGSEEAPRAA